MHYDKIQSELDGLDMRLQKKILSKVNKSLLASSRLTAIVETFAEIKSNKLASVAASPAKIGSPKVTIEPPPKSPMFVMKKRSVFTEDDLPLVIRTGMRKFITRPVIHGLKNSLNPKRPLNTEENLLEDFNNDIASTKISTPKRPKPALTRSSRRLMKYNSDSE